jgi:aminoglycoside phosphotransferase (APT) family kinase protein
MPDDWREAERQARARLRAGTATESLAEGRFERIERGLANHAWRVTAAAGPSRFVRLASATAGEVGADLHAEATALRQVAAAGLAPGVVHCDPASRLLVSEWIEGIPGDSAALGRATVITLVAQALQQLHALAPATGLREVSFERQAGLLQAALPVAMGAAVLDATAPGVFTALAAARPLQVLCHHDVHGGNMLIDPARRLWLVDWEYAGLGDPAFDLASFASQHGLSPAESRLLHASYVEAGGAVPWPRLVLAGWAFDYVQWLWYRTLAARSGAHAGESTARARAAVLQDSLAARASAVLRCNND